MSHYHLVSCYEHQFFSIYSTQHFSKWSQKRNTIKIFHRKLHSWYNFTFLADTERKRPHAHTTSDQSPMAHVLLYYIISYTANFVLSHYYISSFYKESVFRNIQHAHVNESCDQVIKFSISLTVPYFQLPYCSCAFQNVTYHFIFGNFIDSYMHFVTTEAERVKILLRCIFACTFVVWCVIFRNILQAWKYFIYNFWSLICNILIIVLFYKSLIMQFEISSIFLLLLYCKWNLSKHSIRYIRVFVFIV